MAPIRPGARKAPTDPPEPAAPAEPQDEAAVSLAAFLERNGADEAQAYVHRKTPEGWAFVDKQPITDLDEKAIRDRYGAGTYRVRVQARGGKWQGGVYTFHVAAPAQGAAAPLDMNNVMAASVMQMLTLQQQAMQGMAQLFASLGAQRGDPVETALAIVNAIKPAPAAAGGVDTFLEGVKFARELGSGDGEGDGLGSVALALGKPLLEMARTAQAREARRPLPARPPARPALNPSPTETPPAVATPHWLDTFAPYLPMLVRPAARGADPGDYIALILDNTPDATYTEVETSARQDVNFINRTVERALVLCPKLQPYRAWVESLARQLQEDIVAPDDPQGRADDQEEPA